MSKKGGANPPSTGTDTETIVLDGKKIKFKGGALHRMLKIPEDEDIGIPNLRKIAKSEVGAEVTIKGKKFKVTPLMKKRAVFGLNIAPDKSKTKKAIAKNEKNMKKEMKKRGESKGDKSKTRKGDLDYTTKRGDKDFHENKKDVKKSRRPYRRKKKD